MPNKIPTVVSGFDKGAYATWTDANSFAKASVAMGKGLDQVKPIHRSTAAIANRFQNIDGNTSVRDTFSSMDYAFFRPGEQVPKHFRDIIAACMGSYQKVPIIKQVIDLMGDFTAQGIRLIHKNESIERFYNEWFRRVNGPERSERIANILYRCGNVIVKRADAKLNPSIVSSWKKDQISFERSRADTDLDHEEDPIIDPYQVPYRYTILNPLIVEVLGEHMAAFTGKVHYVLKLPSTFYNSLSIPLTSFDPNILTADMPRDLQQAMDKNERYLLLDSEKLICMFYKKDDWDVWAYPMLYSLLDEIILLQKMKQADMTALDGVISHIRVWKLGSLEHKIIPTDAAIAKLSSILLNHLAGGAMDLIWGPDLELDQTKTDIAQFLGSEKYEFCMNTINSGLGIPGAIGRDKGSMTDNFMSLRVLLERLQYGRQVLTRFWEGEIRRVKEAMGFRYPARIMFDNLNLHDEVAEKALWIQLADRDIVPVEAVQERFGRIPEIDNIIIQREYKRREKEKMPIKVSPYVDAQPELSLQKIALQRGLLTPSQVGLETEPPIKREEEIQDNQFPDPAIKLGVPSGPKKTTPKKKSVSGEGRPSGSKDTEKRKTRTPQPNAKASDGENFLRLVSHANMFQRTISHVVNPFFLNRFKTDNIDSLKADQLVEMEKFKFNLLMNVPANEAPREEIVYSMLDKHLSMYSAADEDYKKLCTEFSRKKSSPLNDNDLSNIRSYIYALNYIINRGKDE